MLYKYIDHVLNHAVPSLGDYLPALLMGGPPPGSSSDWSALGRDRSIMLGRHGGPDVPDAHANHVWKAVFYIQVMHANTHTIQYKTIRVQ